MLTRQGRKSPNEEDGEIDRTLQEAGMLEANMTSDEKRTVYKVLQESKVNQVEKETHKLSLISPHSPMQETSESPTHHSFSVSSSSRDKVQMPISSVSTVERKYTEDILTDDITELPSPQREHKQQEPLPRPTSITKEELSVEERRPGTTPGSSRKIGVGRPLGRGRAVPTKGTKYPPLPLSSPGQKHSSPQHRSSSPQHRSLTPDDRSMATATLDSPQSTQSGLLSQQIGSPSSFNPPSPEKRDLPGPCKPTQDDTDVLQVNEAVGGEDDLVDVVSDDPGVETQQGVPNTNDNELQADSPASVKDVEEEEGEEDDDSSSSGGGCDDQKEPVITTQMGKLTVSVSPFEIMLKPMSSMSVPPIFKELGDLRGDESEWMARAKEIVRKHRHAYWDKLLAESPQWGPPIQDGGYNNKTLFKQVVPKYSKLFGSSTEKQGATSVQTERQSKTRAMAKIQESLSDTWAEPDFHSLRRTKPKEVKREDQTGSKQGSGWSTSKSDPDDDDVQCLEDAAGGSGEIWQSARIDQRRKLTDSDPEISPELVHGSGSRDVYEFDDDDWTTATNKNKKNNKRSGKSLQDDVEVEARPSQRGRGSGGTPQNARGRNTRLRLQRGAIARPSEHATCSNNLRNKGCAPEHCEEEANARNNADSGDRAWASRTETDNSNDISPGKFYNPKVIHPRSTPPPQSRRNSRENHRPNDFPASPGSSGGMHGKQHAEVAVIETMPCPICGKNFPKTEIEEHAGQCFNFSDNGVGEESENGSQDSEDSNKTVVEGREVTDQIECSLCKENFTSDDLTIHMKDCFENMPSSSGLKRASPMEVDDGPAKKTSRLLD